MVLIFGLLSTELVFSNTLNTINKFCHEKFKESDIYRL